MKSAKRKRLGTDDTQAEFVASADWVVHRTGEAVVGPVAAMFPSFPAIPGDPDQPWLYFSAPHSSFEAFSEGLSNRAIGVTTKFGSGKLADTILVRVRVACHCAFISIACQEESFASAISAFERSGRIRMLVASQSVRSAPLVFETGWTRPTRWLDSADIRREHSVLSFEGRTMGAVGHLISCEAETPEAWKRRLSKQHR